MAGQVAAAFTAALLRARRVARVCDSPIANGPVGIHTLARDAKDHGMWRAASAPVADVFPETLREDVRVQVRIRAPAEAGWPALLDAAAMRRLDQQRQGARQDGDIANEELHTQCPWLAAPGPTSGFGRPVSAGCKPCSPLLIGNVGGICARCNRVVDDPDSLFELNSNPEVADGLCRVQLKAGALEWEFQPAVRVSARWHLHVIGGGQQAAAGGVDPSASSRLQAVAAVHRHADLLHPAGSGSTAQWPGNLHGQSLATAGALPSTAPGAQGRGRGTRGTSVAKACGHERVLILLRRRVQERSETALLQEASAGALHRACAGCFGDRNHGRHQANQKACFHPGSHRQRCRSRPENSL
mmetsp:Transcript_63043/g.146808  ORF Transcript_63043/g.146808 Transcript_63043/m.146808 type:complete len:357 (+) Transcript_63043:1664-2734(+)